MNHCIGELHALPVAILWPIFWALRSNAYSGCMVGLCCDVHRHRRSLQNRSLMLRECGLCWNRTNCLGLAACELVYAESEFGIGLDWIGSAQVWRHNFGLVRIVSAASVMCRAHSLEMCRISACWPVHRRRVCGKRRAIVPHCLSMLVRTICVTNFPSVFCLPRPARFLFFVFFL